MLTDPSHSLARGLLGLVESRGRWVKPEAVAMEVRSDQAMAEALSEYNGRRAKVRDRADDHYALGLWCEANGLKPEAIAHFTAVTRLDPRREAAWKHLGLRRRNGAWLSEAQAVAFDAEADAQKKADRHCRPLIEKYRAWLGEKARRDDAESRLRDVTDPRAVPSVWGVFVLGKGGNQRLAAQLLGQIDGPAASRALAILAVRSPSPEARRLARELLPRRDPRDFLGLLVDALRKPFKYEVRPIAGPGSTGELLVEGERYNVRRLYELPSATGARLPQRFFTADVPLTPQFGPELSGRARSGDLNAVARRRDAQILVQMERNAELNARNAAAARQALENDVRAVEAINADIARDNDRALPLLKGLTGRDLGADPPAWKAWWTDQQGYASMTPETPEVKPTFDVIVPLPLQSSATHHSCFARGTPVRTLDGLRPIEALRLGDRVVVQDTKTGALTYQPIVAVYHNPPSATYRVALDGEMIVATGIHRFWRAGKGWTMARDLKPGDTLRTLGGTSKVVAVEPDRVQPVFNLEVADGRSFFVGESGALVHDNSLVAPTPEPFDAPRRVASAK